MPQSLSVCLSLSAAGSVCWQLKLQDTLNLFAASFLSFQSLHRFSYLFPAHGSSWAHNYAFHLFLRDENYYCQLPFGEQEIEVVWSVLCKVASKMASQENSQRKITLLKFLFIYLFILDCVQTTATFCLLCLKCELHMRWWVSIFFLFGYLWE